MLDLKHFRKSGPDHGAEATDRAESGPVGNVNSCRATLCLWSG